MLYGKGIKDTKEPISVKEYFYEGGKRRSRTIWSCPYYIKWAHMIKRCYSESFQEQYPSYKICTVCDEWLYFSNFKDWCISYEKSSGICVRDYQLDKDILTETKIYSPQTCIFITNQVNSFVIEKVKDKGLPTGVTYNKQRDKFSVYCRNPFSGKTENLGYARCPLEGHRMWKSKKRGYVEEFFKQGKICRVIYEALLLRYSDNSYVSIKASQAS